MSGLHTIVILLLGNSLGTAAWAGSLGLGDPPSGSRPPTTNNNNNGTQYDSAPADYSGVTGPADAAINTFANTDTNDRAYDGLTQSFDACVAMINAGSGGKCDPPQTVTQDQMPTSAHANHTGTTSANTVRTSDGTQVSGMDSSNPNAAGAQGSGTSPAVQQALSQLTPDQLVTLIYLLL